MTPTVVAFALKLLIGCYAYAMTLATANVVTCELRRGGTCEQHWTQAFTVAGGATSTLWAFLLDSPTPRRRNDATSQSNL